MSALVTEETTYRSVEVCRLAPVGYRSFDYWCRMGIFGAVGVGQGSGSRRSGFSAADVKVARALARLSAAGVAGGTGTGDTSMRRLAGPVRAAAEAGRDSATLALGWGVLVAVSLLADDLSEP